MEPSLVEIQNRATIESAIEIATGKAKGIVIVAKQTGEEVSMINATYGAKMTPEEIRKAVLGAIIALGKVTEHAATIGPVLEPRD